MDHEPSNITITLQNIGRRFNREWIFRGVDKTFVTGKSYAILGPNGSGKSTLLQVLNGSLAPSAGNINYLYNNKNIAAEDIYQYLALAAPYMDLVEDFTLSEVIDFHFKFKCYRPGLNRQGLTALLGMESSINKLVRYFSSGMKQRLKLALAFCADTPILMLDEPTANLDIQGTAWYLELVGQFLSNRLTIICSNQEQEYNFCDEQINVGNYKTALHKQKLNQ